MRQLGIIVVTLLLMVATPGPGASATEAGVFGEDAPPDGVLPAGTAGGSSFPPGYPEYGVDDLIVYNMPGFAFNNLRDAQHGRSSPGSYLYNSGGTSNTYDATFHLPSGAVISGVTPYIYDADPGADVTVYLYRLDYHGYPPAPSSTNLLTVSSDGDDGYWFFYTPLPVPEVVRNGYPPTFSTFYYLVVVSVDPSGSAFNLTFGGLTIWYKLQVSPAPATATFADVPTGHMFFQYVEALADSGITAGCGGGNFCPDAPLTRGQMAVFLAKALGLHWAY